MRRWIGWGVMRRFWCQQGRLLRWMWTHLRNAVTRDHCLQCGRRYWPLLGYPKRWRPWTACCSRECLTAWLEEGGPQEAAANSEVIWL